MMPLKAVPRGTITRLPATIGLSSVAAKLSPGRIYLVSSVCASRTSTRVPAGITKVSSRLSVTTVRCTAGRTLGANAEGRPAPGGSAGSAETTGLGRGAGCACENAQTDARNVTGITIRNIDYLQ